MVEDCGAAATSAAVPAGPDGAKSADPSTRVSALESPEVRLLLLGATSAAVVCEFSEEPAAEVCGVIEERISFNEKKAAEAIIGTSALQDASPVTAMPNNAFFILVRKSKGFDVVSA